MAAISIHKMNEVYVWMNGSLIYKKWLGTSQSMIFDKMTYGRDTLVSITEDSEGNIITKKN